MSNAVADKPRKIIVTPGEPAGIGPDILVQLACTPQRAQLIALADPQLLEERAKRLGILLKLTPFDPALAARPTRQNELFVVPLKMAQRVEPGQGNPGNAEYLLASLRHATQMCIDQQADALVTGPVNKHLVNQGLLKQKSAETFTGHTEFLASITNTDKVVMMLTDENNPALNKALRVALVTTHMPLSAVSGAITPAVLEQTLRILNTDLQQKFGIVRPKILVCGLNPHAGEQGDLGREELEIINPCLTAMREQGMDVSDALPADTLFTPRYLQQADAVLAMYHDQGLPVLKSHGFGRAVNVTLGLPIVRCSVDHGTAFDLAGTGQADAGSLQSAINCAISIANARRRSNG